MGRLPLLLTLNPFCAFAGKLHANSYEEFSSWNEGVEGKGTTEQLTTIEVSRVACVVLSVCTLNATLRPAVLDKKSLVLVTMFPHSNDRVACPGTARATTNMGRIIAKSYTA